MKRFKWPVLGLVVVLVVILSLAGCVSKSTYEALQEDYAKLTADYDELQNDYDDLDADYEAVSNELAAIGEIYPPRDFSSLAELRE
ncbi:MAG: hypothetical protein FJ025_04230 [Chloroflexi bacterium]|nr:hypothetical protein [Chloroflexota bacterium]